MSKASVKTDSLQSTSSTQRPVVSGSKIWTPSLAMPAQQWELRPPWALLLWDLSPELLCGLALPFHLSTSAAAPCWAHRTTSRVLTLTRLMYPSWTESLSWGLRARGTVVLPDGFQESLAARDHQEVHPRAAEGTHHCVPRERTKRNDTTMDGKQRTHGHD